MGKDFSFRNATAADWPAVAELLTAVHLPLAGAEEHLGNFTLAFRNDRLVGSIGLERYGPYAILRSVAVMPHEQGQGLGKELVEHQIDYAHKIGIAHLVLLTESAQDFFSRFGFRIIPREAAPKPVTASVEFQGACPVSATVMQYDG